MELQQFSTLEEESEFHLKYSETFGTAHTLEKSDVALWGRCGTEQFFPQGMRDLFDTITDYDNLFDLEKAKIQKFSGN